VIKKWLRFLKTGLNGKNDDFGVFLAQNTILLVKTAKTVSPGAEIAVFAHFRRFWPLFDHFWSLFGSILGHFLVTFWSLSWSHS